MTTLTDTTKIPSGLSGKQKHLDFWKTRLCGSVECEVKVGNDTQVLQETYVIDCGLVGDWQMHHWAYRNSCSKTEIMSYYLKQVETIFPLRINSPGNSALVFRFYISSQLTSIPLSGSRSPVYLFSLWRNAILDLSSTPYLHSLTTRSWRGSTLRLRVEYRYQDSSNAPPLVRGSVTRKRDRCQLRHPSLPLPSEPEAKSRRSCT